MQDDLRSNVHIIGVTGGKRENMGNQYLNFLKLMKDVN